MEKTDMLRSIAEHYKIERNAEFARFFGITPQAAFSRMKQGIIDFEEIYEKCPDISPDWLLSRGENGPMLRAECVTGGVFSPVSVTHSEPPHKTVTLALESLTREQEALQREQVALSRSQDQITGLIEIIKGK